MTSLFFYTSLDSMPRHFYREVLRIVTNYQNSVSLQQCLLLLLYLLNLLRFALHLHIFYWNFDVSVSWWTVDYLAAVGYHHPTDYNLLLCFIILMMLLFGAIAQWLLYFRSRPESVAWQLLLDIVVRNTDIYLDCRMKDSVEVARVRSARRHRIEEKRQKKWWWQRTVYLLLWPLFPRDLVALYCRWRVTLAVWWNFEAVEVERMMRRKLSYAPGMSLRGRKRLMDGLDLFEIIFFYFPFVFCECLFVAFLCDNLLQLVLFNSHLWPDLLSLLPPQIPRTVSFE